MGLWDILVIAVALSLDACTVAICNVLGLKQYGKSKGLWRMPLAFGAFQSFMPLVGIAIGKSLAGFIGQIGPYLTALVLGVLGTNMIINAFRGEDTRPIQSKLGTGLLLTQAIVTSLDALFVGVGFGTLGVHPANVLIIGIITAALVTLSIIVGRRLGDILGAKAELSGGLLLYLVALRSLMSLLP